MTDDVVVRDLHYAYPHAGGGDEVAPVLRGVNLQVISGEYVVLLGRVGAGKTTLCLALNGLVPHATGGRYRGNVTVLGQNTKEHPVADLARVVGLVFQDPETQLTQMRVEDEVAFGLENLGLPPAEIEERVTWALDAVGLFTYRDRSPLRLSGGQKQRVAIAAVLAMQPRLLVLDEPTASLDPIGKVGVFNVLADLARERRLAVVMTTQELEWVPRFADRVLVLHEGRIALEGAPEEVFYHVRELQEWGIGVPQMVELADRLSHRTGYPYRFSTVAGGYRQLTRHAEQEVNPGSVPTARQAMPVAPPGQDSAGTSLASRPGSAKVIPSRDDIFRRLDFSLTPPPRIRVEDVFYTYADGTAALQGVGLNLEPGEFVALLGPNGSGKTTLAKHLDGLLRPSAGRVLVGDRDTRTASVAQLARQVGYVFQNPDHQIFAATVEEEVAFGPRSQGLPDDVVPRRAAEALDLFGLASFAGVPPASLGLAQRRQVALAAVLAAEPRVLILDEPTGGLDARSRREIMSVIAAFNAGALARLATPVLPSPAVPPARTVDPGRASGGEEAGLGAQATPPLGAAGGTVLLITHDMALVAEYARRAVVLVDGRVLFDGAVSDLFRQRDLLARAGLGLPPVVRLANRLARHGLAAGVLTPDDLVEAWAGPESATLAPQNRVARSDPDATGL